MAKATIHPTALVEAGARLGEDVLVGPFCTVGPEVTVGNGTRLISHVVLAGRTVLGENNVVYPFASLGQPTPDRKYAGEPTTLVIGDGNDIREYVTMHIGTAVDKGTTVIGNRNLFMAGAHVAHDCVVGDHNTFANFVQLAGHVTIEDRVTIGGLAGIRQRTRVGSYTIVGAATAVDYDTPPYANVYGARGTLQGLNLVGLRRRNLGREVIKALIDAYATLFGDRRDNMDTESTLMARAAALRDSTPHTEVRSVAEFVLAAQRGVISYVPHAKE